MRELKASAAGRSPELLAILVLVIRRAQSLEIMAMQVQGSLEPLLKAAY